MPISRDLKILTQMDLKLHHSALRIEKEYSLSVTEKDEQVRKYFGLSNHFTCKNVAFIPVVCSVW